ncbi:cobalt-precorrin-5B (C(1))-methyltransferase [Beijerinckia indica]|uniref:Cobalt-precorrin-5B C(1)-methyltransferase n=1 Tax=Beijerinckia indica subsp. indica (strain ATCC 9039 / DSM 1715 / NCIMB 8712) TaxID=395963 RepID=B2IFH4_BEII9|nr:cobalt-precorrin-5B (C(1))-methyltransferase [Beijerinckia indica]ACB97074.1 cobalamin biosynthesis protein CbiD [Beijerinckia indica subsp. indica ATCC 9039]
MDEGGEKSPLRKGWTTGACATAASRAAYEALLTGHFPDPVSITLPGGQTPAFTLAFEECGEGFAAAGIIKDAGDDPDVTHGALIIARLRKGVSGSGISFRAGEGVGTITRPGLPLPPGEPAINPMPRKMIRAAIEEAAQHFGGSTDIEVEISVPGGEKLAEHTLNRRLGIVGGLSILGTTGIVVPYSCSAWIDSIHRGVDVARAAGLDHIAGATGSTSEAAIQRLDNLPDMALIEMGDFAGGMLKYLRRHPVAKVTIAGGFAKLTKLGQGFVDLHSRRGSVDLAWLAAQVPKANSSLHEAIRAANSAKEVYEIAQKAGLDLAVPVAEAAWRTAAKVLRGTEILLDIAVFDREGGLLARTDSQITNKF